MASDIPTQILEALSSTDEPILSADAFPSTPFLVVKSALDRLASRNMVEYETIEREEAILSPEAEQIAANGSHEAKVFEAVLAAVDGLKIGDLPAIVGRDVAKVGAGNAFKKGWIKKDKDVLRAATDSIEDVAQQQLEIIQKTKTYPDHKVILDLRKRK